MQVSEFDYELPEELIAQKPIEPRDAARLLVLHRREGRIEHRTFADLPEYLTPYDALVLNDTRVFKSRLVGHKSTGGQVEILLLQQMGDGAWKALVRPSRRLRPGTVVQFADPHFHAVVDEPQGDGIRRVRLSVDGPAWEVLERVGRVPLPPYIRQDLHQTERYQTVYANEAGSAAAPTAGLHFTPQLLERIQASGTALVHVTLHVGIGTFRPVKVDRVEEHVMHHEWYSVSQAAADTLNRVRQGGGRVVAVGTTSCRTIESAAKQGGQVVAGSGETNLFIYPGYPFQFIDALVTNFHLPKSTLLMLVSAFAGQDLTRAAYQEAVARRYRFFSFGDAMLIV